MTEAERKVQTVRIGRQFLTEATRLARVAHRSTAGQIEYWARLGRALEASPAFSTADVNAVLAGTMKIDALNNLERAAFVERLPEAFRTPSPELTAAYASLSDDPESGTRPQHQGPNRSKIAASTQTTP
jgi:hypothetical protein